MGAPEGSVEQGPWVEVSQVIDRSVADVFRWYADDHVRNHPRWDPALELEQLTDGPVGVGTVIKRRHARFGTPVEGTMEVTEYEPGRAIGMVIEEGPLRMVGRATFAARGEGRTVLTLGTEAPAGVEADQLRAMIAGSAQRIKDLIESDL